MSRPGRIRAAGPRLAPRAEVAISAVVPLLDEEESLPQMAAELEQALEAVGEPYELIFVDDGSTDGSVEVLLGLRAQGHQLKVIQLRRNYGKTAALDAGFRHSRGRYLVTLDADLQDDPGQIALLLSRLEEGLDLVVGWRRTRRDAADKRWPSRVFNAAVAWAAGVRLHDLNCGFKGYRREVIEDIKLYGELHRFIPVLAAFRGYRVGEVPVDHRPRRYGRSKYGPGRLWKGALDFLTVLFLTTFLRRPLHLFGSLGLGLVLIGLAINVYLSVLWLQGQPIGTRPLLQLGVLSLLAGLQLAGLGLLGEMIRHFAFRAEEEYSIRRIWD